jgi:hypothetical protein
MGFVERFLRILGMTFSQGFGHGVSQPVTRLPGDNHEPPRPNFIVIGSLHGSTQHFFDERARNRIGFHFFV